SRVKEDAALGIVLSVFFGAGIVMLTQIQRSGSGNQSGLDKFLFGQAASMVGNDVRLIAGVALLLCLLSAALYKEFKILCFDSDFGRGLGLPVHILDAVLMAMIVAAVVIGLQAVGVVLMAAMLITPPAAARFWTEKLHGMVTLSALFGGLSGALGTLLSTVAPRMPTGPLIVLAATGIFVFSLLFAPRRGVVARAWRILSTQKTVRRENLLRDLFELTEEALPASPSRSALAGSTTDFHGITPTELAEKRHARESTVRAGLGGLQKQGWARLNADGRWVLTQTGMLEAYRMVRQHRLWEMFLMYETSLGLKNVDRDADAVEHFLPPEAIGQLEQLLQEHGREPRLVPQTANV
ncbi:MAG TPA: iron chelate uptake ABC transporter family permease subunit, partial [Abditibacteriaceae bacterium]